MVEVFVVDACFHAIFDGCFYIRNCICDTIDGSHENLAVGIVWTFADVCQNSDEIIVDHGDTSLGHNLVGNVDRHWVDWRRCGSGTVEFSVVDLFNGTGKFADFVFCR